MRRARRGEEWMSIGLAAGPVSSAARRSFDVADLESLFDSEFVLTANTCLRGGVQEPVYLPADDTGARHRILYREDYFASALHEVAHWCIAGEHRRRLPDYGYWYVPEGRNGLQQQRFEAVEARPQALEWIFSSACGFHFRPSTDNLSADAEGAASAHGETFYRAIYRELSRYCDRGLPQRAARFRCALSRFYATEAALELAQFSPEFDESASP